MSLRRPPPLTSYPSISCDSATKYLSMYSAARTTAKPKLAAASTHTPSMTAMPPQLSPAERTAVHLFFAQQKYLAWAHQHALEARRAISNEALHPNEAKTALAAKPIPIQALNIKDVDVGWTSGAWLWDTTQAPVWFQRALGVRTTTSSKPALSVQPLGAQAQSSAVSDNVRAWTPSRMRAPPLPTMVLQPQHGQQQLHLGVVQEPNGKRKHRRTRRRQRKSGKQPIDRE